MGVGLTGNDQMWVGVMIGHHWSKYWRGIKRVEGEPEGLGVISIMTGITVTGVLKLLEECRAIVWGGGSHARGMFWG